MSRRERHLLHLKMFVAELLTYQARVAYCEHDVKHDPLLMIVNEGYALIWHLPIGNRVVCCVPGMGALSRRSLTSLQA